jgi:aldose sugar dehydrogenase
MEDPRVDWTPSIAPAGMTVYRGAQFPDWQGDLLVTALVAREVRRVRLDGERVTGQEALFGEIGERLRDIKTGPDGALYVLTDTAPGARAADLRPAVMHAAAALAAAGLSR